MHSNIDIHLLKEEEILMIVDAFEKAHWPKPISTFQKYLQEQNEGTRFVWVAFIADHLAGYVTLSWQSKYPPFAKANIPEIIDLNVLPQYRNLGIGNRLLDQAERRASAISDKVGIGVGLYAGKDGGYGAAQKIYVKRGYIPDGKGLTYDCNYVEPGKSYPVDDDLILWFIKDFELS